MLWSIDNTWTLFLDRDGVINTRIPDDYVKSIAEFEFIEGSVDAIVLASSIFKYVFVVTNQQGIGKGIMTESNLLDVHNYMRNGIQNAGGRIDQCYFAPQLASEKSEMRKPGSGMAFAAKKDYDEVDFSKSVMVGDSDSDIEFGKKLGMKTVKVNSDLQDSTGADLVVASLGDFIKLLK